MKFKVSFLIFIFLSTFIIAQDDEYERIEKGYELLYYSDIGDIIYIKSLIEIENVDVNFTDEDGISAIMLASQAGYSSIIEYLIAKGADVNIKSKEFEITPLTSAVKNNQLVAAEILIRNGADIDAKDSYMRAAISYSVAFQYETMTDMLLYYDADPDVKDVNGYTPLAYAIENNDNVLINLLIEKGAKLNLFTNDKTSVLHIAAYNGNLDFVKKYAKYFNVNKDVDINNMTAVDMAVAGGHSEIIKWFLDSGYELRDSINDIYTPRTLAKASKDSDTKRIIRKMKINDKFVLYPQRISLGYDFLFNADDFFMNANIGIQDAKYGLGAEAGFLFRPKNQRVILPKADDVFYILREKRMGAYLGIYKKFKIFNLSDNTYLSLIAKLRSVMFWGRYKGMDMKVSNEIMAVPGVGITMNMFKCFELFFECSYMDMSLYDSDQVFYTLGMKGLINFRSSKSNDAKKYIINY